jgi:hypothetical protein
VIRKYLVGLTLAAALTDPEIVREAMSLWYRQSLLQFHFSPASYLLFFALRLIPFAVVAIILWKTKDARLHWPIFAGGTISILALILWATWATERPLFTGGRYASTSALAYVFIPIFAVPAAITGVLSAIGFAARRHKGS